MRNIRKNLTALLKKHPHLVQNYNLLVASYWWNYDKARGLTEVQFATPMESITRMCRKLVEEGVVYLPANTREIRKKKEAEFRNEFSKKVQSGGVSNS